MDKKLFIGSLLAVFLISLLLIPSHAAGQSYKFQRMWPTLQQPWYFSGPSYIALDKKGAVFVTDRWNHRIQKFSPDGIFITKWGRYGTGNGEFDSPHGVAVDHNGFVYVADQGNHRIQKFSPDGVFITKWGGRGTGNGEVDTPYGIAVDNSGFLYVADEGNHRIQKFTPDGVFITKWGTFGTGDGQFKCPASIAVDSQGFVYVTDFDNHRIQKFSPDGVFITKWGTLGTGNGQFDSPYGIGVDPHGFVYVTDDGNHRIQKFSANGVFISKWGAFGTGNGQFRNPYGIAVSSGYVYIADYNNERVQQFSSEGLFITKWGSIGMGDGEFYYPFGIAANSSFVYVTDDGNHRIQKFSPDGIFISKWGTLGTGNGQFNCPAGIDVDSSGFVYVVDYSNNRIQKFDPDGQFITKWGAPGTGDGKFQDPYGVAAAGSGFVYVADTGNHRIQKFSPDGVFISKWGSYGSGDGDFDRPWGIAADSAGFIYVSDGGNQRTQKFTGNGQFVTRWGNEVGETDYFSFPSSLAVAGDGRVYIADVRDNRVLVFNQVTLSSNNKAIVIAGGGPFEGNHLWDATQMSANFAYQALIYQGFNKNSIFYMTQDSDLDIDNNGVLDDVDSDVTLADLQEAITVWGANADNLVIYIVDHGGNGTVRMNGSEILAASELDLWLDTVQATIPGKIILVYDACESGSFLEALTPPEGKERIIIASTSPGERAYFLSQGSVSFSYFFWTNIFNGNNIKDAFDMARGALNQAISIQTPLLDDNNNGIGNEPVDGDLARNTHIGNGTVVSGNIPVIASVSPDQSISAVSSASISAYDVTDSDGIARVWAVIIPPGFSHGSSNNAVQGLPYLDLLPVGGARYEAAYDQFNIEGTYQIAVYARDRVGNTSTPKFTSVSVGNPLRRKAIIIAGGSQADENWRAIEKGALAAYNALTFQGYTNDDIYFLSPVTFSSGVDGLSVMSNVSYAINNWAAGSTWDAVIYMIGNGEDGTFRINNTETLAAADLGAWLDNLQNAISGKVTVIYDAERAGSFIPLLTAPPGKERIIVTSTGKDEPVYFLSDGDISFSRYFWIRILNGLNVRDAYISARQAMSFTSGQKQTAFLNDNGNDIGNETGDGLISRSYTIGVGIQLAGNDPLIGSVTEDQILYGTTSSSLWADKVTSTGTIDKVWAVITPPGYVSGGHDQSMTALQELVLGKAGSGRYEGTYTDFTIFGVYHITIYAMDVDGNISTVKVTTVQQTDAPDMYEDDDTYNQAKDITLNDPYPQQHNFHDEGDADWVKFSALMNEPYTFKASNLGPDCDAVMELYDSDGITRIAQWNNPGAGVEELHSYIFLSDGTYYLKVTNAAGGVFGNGTGYDLYFFRESGAFYYVTFRGLVKNAVTGVPMQGVPVRFGNYGGVSQAGSGYYAFVVIMSSPSESHTLTATYPAYYNYSKSMTIRSGIDPYEVVSMVPYCTDIDGDGYGNPGSSGCTHGGAQDCNDGNSSIHPGATEICDSIDNNCNGLIDDNDPGVTGQSTWHPDYDNDGYGNGSISLKRCVQPSGFILNGTDCDDNNDHIYPGGPPVRINAATPAYYLTLQAAYEAANDGDSIQSKNILFTQNLTFYMGKSVFFEGGFDCSFSTITGNTAINGNILNSHGLATLENFSIE